MQQSIITKSNVDFFINQMSETKQRDFDFNSSFIKTLLSISQFPTQSSLQEQVY